MFALTPRTVSIRTVPEVVVTESPAEPAPTGAVIAELHIVPPDALVVLQGEIDLHNLARLEQALDVVTGADVRRVTVDLTRVDFASLGALNALVESARVLSCRSGRMTVQGAKTLHHRVLGLLEPPATLDVMATAG